MEKKVYICDLCGKERDSNIDLARFVVTSGWDDIERIKTSIYVDICKSCMEKKGFVYGDNADIAANENTLKRKLLDILRDACKREARRW